MTDKLDFWISEMRRAGFRFFTPCLSCGEWYACKTNRAIECKKLRCNLWREYREKENRAPPESLMKEWRNRWGDTSQTSVKNVE